MNDRRVNLFDGTFSVNDGVRCNLHGLLSPAIRDDNGDIDAYDVCEFSCIFKICHLKHELGMNKKMNNLRMKNHTICREKMDAFVRVENNRKQLKYEIRSAIVLVFNSSVSLFLV